MAHRPDPACCSFSFSPSKKDKKPKMLPYWSITGPSCSRTYKRKRELTHRVVVKEGSEQEKAKHTRQTGGGGRREQRTEKGMEKTEHKKRETWMPVNNAPQGFVHLSNVTLGSKSMGNPDAEAGPSLLFHLL